LYLKYPDWIFRLLKSSFSEKDYNRLSKGLTGSFLFYFQVSENSKRKFSIKHQNYQYLYSKENPPKWLVHQIENRKEIATKTTN
jgi:hypothetical protein